MTSVSPRILYCHCTYAQTVPREVKATVLRQLCESGVSFEAVADLCELAARKDPLLKELPEGGGLKIAACYPRAVKWLFAAAQAPLDQDRTEVLNMRAQSATEVVSALLNPKLSSSDGRRQKPDRQSMLRVVLCEGNGARPGRAEERLAAMTALLERGFAVTRVAGDVRAAPLDPPPLIVLAYLDQGTPPEAKAHGEQLGARFHDIAGLNASQIVEVVEAARVEIHAARPGEWPPWFPVIDYDRCTHCMQCLSFCLFGVYGVDGEQKIQVQSPQSCKTNCPACSRVCPEAAIIFPKYKSGPINGENVNASGPRREAMKIDISALLGGDIHSVLRERSERARTRFSKERDAHTALQERQRCIARLAQAADIPPEVLMSLPSPEEIQRKAQEAAARAKAALSAQGATPATKH